MTESTAHRAADMFNAGATTIDVAARFGGKCVYDDSLYIQYEYSDGTTVEFDLMDHVAEVVE